MLDTIFGLGLLDEQTEMCLPFRISINLTELVSWNMIGYSLRINRPIANFLVWGFISLFLTKLIFIFCQSFIC